MSKTAISFLVIEGAQPPVLEQGGGGGNQKTAGVHRQHSTRLRSTSLASARSITIPISSTRSLQDLPAVVSAFSSSSSSHAARTAADNVHTLPLASLFPLPRLPTCESPSSPVEEISALVGRLSKVAASRTRRHGASGRRPNGAALREEEEETVALPATSATTASQPWTRSSANRCEPLRSKRCAPPAKTTRSTSADESEVLTCR